MSWENKAACIGRKDLNFFCQASDDDYYKMKARCIAVCMGCMVQTECLTYALAAVEKHGIWGGRTPKQRRAINQGQGVILYDDKAPSA